MDILNIDELATPATKKIVIKGKEYEVKEMSVQGFIDTSRAAKALDEDPKATEWQKVENMVNMVASLIPDCSREDISSLDFNQLNAMVAFGRGVLAEEVKNMYGIVPEEEPSKKPEGTSSPKQPVKKSRKQAG